MKNIVTFEQAKKLKELGFNIWSQFSYYKNDITFQKTPERFTSDYSVAPSISEALQWIREKYNLMCGISLDSQWREYKWWYEVDKDYIVPHVFSETSINGYDDYPEAESELLNGVLNYLEKRK